MSTTPARAYPASTVIVLRPAASGFELLMVRRPQRGAFGGLAVFPGGKVEPVDSSRLSHDVVLSNSDDHSFRSAALRELAEETGLLLTGSGLVLSPEVHGEALWRAVENDGEVVPGDDLILVSRWVTPEIQRRRFDTRFYLLTVGETPTVRLDKSELTDHAWVTPRAALRRHEDGEWPMILPTISHLRWLTARASIAEARESAMGADGGTVIEPRLMENGSLLPSYLPGDV